MAGFVKLFSQVLDSTIWDEPWEVKGVWITLLAMADSRGRVMASVPGLARRATVTLEQCEKAMAVFMAPDKYSRTTDYEGRRLETIDGGWRLLNYIKYREMRDDDVRKEQNRTAQQKHRASARKDDGQHGSAQKADCQQRSSSSAQAEAEAEAEKKKTTTLPTASPSPRLIPSLEVIKTQEGIETFARIWKRWPATRPDGAKARGHKIEAENAFQRILSSRAATAAELEKAVELYLTQHPNVAKGYVVMVSTYFGNQKGLWLESMRYVREDAARAGIPMLEAQ